MHSSVRGIVRLSALLATLGVGAPPAFADALGDCVKLRAEKAIPHCSIVISDKKQRAPKRAYALIMRARAALDIGDLKSADTDLNAAFELRTPTSFGYRVRGRLRGLQSRPGEARADLTKAIQLAEKQSEQYVSYVDRAIFLRRTLELAPALADYDAAIGIDPTRANAYVGRALIKKALGKPSEALADLDRAAAVDPSFRPTYLERGDLLTAEKRYSEAIAAYDAALALDGDPNRAQRGRAAASALLASTKTIATAQPAAPTQPTPAKAPTPPAQPAKTASPSEPPPATVRPPAPVLPGAVPTPGAPPATPAVVPPVKTADPVKPLAPGKPDGAPSSTPTAPPLAKTGQPGPASAEQIAAAAEERRKQLLTALDLRRKRKFNEALAIYDDLLRLVPTDAEVSVEKGRVLMALAKWKEAITLLQSVATSKTAPLAIKALAYEGAGEIFARFAQFADAIQQTTSALKINAKLEGALFWRGYSWHAMSAFDKALADFKQTAQLRPQSTIYQGWLAIALASAGDTTNASKAIEPILAARPRDPLGLTARARMRLVSGDVDGATADLATLAQLGPLSLPAVQTQQFLLLHRVLKPTDRPLNTP